MYFRSVPPSILTDLKNVRVPMCNRFRNISPTLFETSVQKYISSQLSNAGVTYYTMLETVLCRMGSNHDLHLCLHLGIN